MFSIRYSFRLWALFYLFFTDSEFTSQEKLFVFFRCGGNGAIAFVFFLLLKTAGNIDSNVLPRHPNEKSVTDSLFLLIILVKKALLLTGIPSCIFPFSGTFEYIIGLILFLPI
jgi:hypothetical protein